MFQISVLEMDDLLSYESHFKGIIEQIILYIRGILDFTATSKVAFAKYWKVMISLALEILNKVIKNVECFKTRRASSCSSIGSIEI